MRAFRDTPTDFLAQKDTKVVSVAAPADLDALIARMVGGDREAVGQFLVRYGPLIRRRVRGKLRASVRRLFDSQDILSTVGRRLDVIVSERRVVARSEGEFWALVLEVVGNSVIEKGRLVEALRKKEGEDSAFASEMLARIGAAERDAPHQDVQVTFDQLLAPLKVEQDRTIATLWAVGFSFVEIAEHLGTNSEHVRQRWRRIRETLRGKFEEAGP